MGDAGIFAGIWYAFGTVGGPLARQWRGCGFSSDDPPFTALSDLLQSDLISQSCLLPRNPSGNLGF
jgi:hypothetical protein